MSACIPTFWMCSRLRKTSGRACPCNLCRSRRARSCISGLLAKGLRRDETGKGRVASALGSARGVGPWRAGRGTRSRGEFHVLWGELELSSVSNALTQQNARERVGFFLMQLSPDAPLDPLTPPNGADWPGACTFRPGTAHHQPPLTIRDRGRSISSRLASPAYGAHRASARWLSVSDAPPRRGLGPAPNISGRTLHFRRPNLLGDFLLLWARRRLSESIS